MIMIGHPFTAIPPRHARGYDFAGSFPARIAELGVAIPDASQRRIHLQEQKKGRIQKLLTGEVHVWTVLNERKR